MDTDRIEEEARLLHDPDEDTNRSQQKGAGRWILSLLALAGLGYFIYYAWGHWVKPAAADATAAQSAAAGGGGRGGRGGGRGGVGPRGAAVVTIAARRVDMPVYLRGLGTVAAYNTVVVRSRVDGQLQHVAFREGQFVEQGDLLAEIDKRPFEVQLAQANLGEVLKKLRAGQQLRVEAWDHDDSKKIADGVLLTADNQIDATTGTSKLKAIFDNKNNALYPNQFVNVRLLIDVLKGAVVVPGATIQRGSQGTFVYVVTENQTAELRMVTIKDTEGNDVAIASGITPGENVVLEGMDKVQDGARVDVQTPGQSSEEVPGGRRGTGGGFGGGRGARGRGQRNGG